MGLMKSEMSEEVYLLRLGLESGSEIYCELELETIREELRLFDESISKIIARRNGVKYTGRRNPTKIIVAEG
jgi:hypothetical protein